MRTAIEMPTLRTHRDSTRSPVIQGSPSFDWVMTALSALWVGGLFLDGWAHTHGRVDDTFFTPWHAALYGGWLAVAGALLGVAGNNLLHGARDRRILPDGHGLSLLGVALWVVGGPFDFAWHEIFGFEADVEALMSPAHTVLALGMALAVSGPARAGLRRPGPASWWARLPLVLSVTLVVCVLTFFTQIAHPLANLWARGPAGGSGDSVELGLVSFLLTSAILAGALLLLVRAGSLPAGGAALMLAVNSLSMGVVYDQGDYPLVPALALAASGVLADLVRAALRPASDRPAAARGFAFAAPALFTLCYFAALAVTDGIAWSAHLWLGTVVFAGLAGWLLSYLSFPPRRAA